MLSEWTVNVSPQEGSAFELPTREINAQISLHSRLHLVLKVEIKMKKQTRFRPSEPADLIEYRCEIDGFFLVIGQNIK